MILYRKYQIIMNVDNQEIVNHVNQNTGPEHANNNSIPHQSAT